MSRTIFVMCLLLGTAGSAQAQSSLSQCLAELAEICARDCAALGSNGNDGCIGACLNDSSCEPDNEQQAPRSSAGNLPDSSLPDSTLPNGTLPDSTMPDSLLR